MKYNALTNRNWKIRILQALNHVALVYALLQGWTPLWIASVAVYFVMFCIGVNIGVHRYFSHQSFETGPVQEWFMGIAMCLASLGSPLAWAGMHRMHHQFSDSGKDPHTPLVDGKASVKSFLRTYIGVWSQYVASPKYIRDIKKMTLHKVLHFYYFGFIFSYILLLALLDPVLVIYLYCLPAVMSFHAASCIVTVGHVLGHKPHNTRDSSRNNVVLHWLTFGEGLHNEHHAYPRNAIYLGKPWYFFDLPGFLIQTVFRKKRLTVSSIS